MDVLNNSVNEILKNKHKLLLFIVVIVTLILFLIVGIVFIQNHTQQIDGEDPVVLNYTSCVAENSNHCPGSPIDRKSCACYVEFSMTKQMKGPITIYYKLDSYDQSKYENSRDDNQLRGDLSSPPSLACGNYSTNEGKPIAPCGALADSIFNDTFSIFAGEDFPTFIYTGLEGITDEDRVNYHNPPGNLEKAFENYTKPINWYKNIWEKNVWEDSDGPIRGLQNEAFIAWMKTDMKMKPVMRLNHTGIFEHGLPIRNYTLRVQNYYPYSLYSGDRLVIITNLHTIISEGNLVLGQVFTIISSIILILIIIIFINTLFDNKKVYGHYTKTPNLFSSQ